MVTHTNYRKTYIKYIKNIKKLIRWKYENIQLWKYKNTKIYNVLIQAYM